MSTELKTRSNEVYALTRFWGGDSRGTCVQVTLTTVWKPGLRWFSMNRSECLDFVWHQKNDKAFYDNDTQAMHVIGGEVVYLSLADFKNLLLDLTDFAHEFEVTVFD